MFPLYGFFPYIISNVTLSHRWDFNFTFYSAINAVDKTIHHIHYKPTDYYAFFQPSIIYKFNPHLNAAVSYCYQRNNPFNEQYFNEHRFWEQITYTHPIHQWNFMTRLRYEERFIQNRTLHQYPFFSRIRYIIDFIKPFHKDFWLHNLYFHTNNEFFISFTNIQNARYSDNWLYAGLGWSIGKAGRMETGYMMQASEINVPYKHLQMLNMLQITWITNFELHHHG